MNRSRNTRLEERLVIDLPPITPDPEPEPKKIETFEEAPVEEASVEIHYETDSEASFQPDVDLDAEFKPSQVIEIVEQDHPTSLPVLATESVERTESALPIENAKEEEKA